MCVCVSVGVWVTIIVFMWLKAVNAFVFFVLSVGNHCAYHVYKLVALHVVCADSL